jgi:hypothetical protein
MSWAVFAAIALTGCGPGGEDQANPPAVSETAAPATQAGTIDPCSLLTAEEIGQVIGEKVVTTKPSEGICTYQTADAQASSVTIEVNQSDATGQMEFAKRTAGALEDIGAEAAAGGGAAGRDVGERLSRPGDLPRLGDQAFFGANTQLNVLKGNTYLAISPPIMRSRMAAGNPMLSASDRKKIAVAIAQVALARVP